MWFLGIFLQVRCGCILEPGLFNGERVSVLSTQPIQCCCCRWGSFFMQQLCEEVLCTLDWAHAREVYERHVNPMGPSTILWAAKA